MSYITIGQTSNVLPFQFDQIQNSFEMVNPGSIEPSKLKLKSGNNIYAPDISAFRTHYFITQVQVSNWNATSNQSTQILGANIYIDKVSRFIHNNRLLLSYAWRKPIFNNTILTAGTNSGLVNRTLSTTSVSSSDFAPNINVGIQVEHNSYKLGVSANQLTNSTLSPIFEVSRYIRHMVYNFGTTFELSHQIDLRSDLYFLQVNGLKNQLDLLGQIVIKNNLVLGADYRHQRSVIAMIGLENFELRRNTGSYNLMLSYNLSTSKYRGGSVELTMSYKLK